MLVVILVAAATFALQAALPGRVVPGYVLTETKPHVQSTYKLNGFLTLLLVTAVAVCALALNPPALVSDLVDAAPSAAAASCVLGLVATVAFYIRGRVLQARGAIDERSRCPTVDAATSPATDCVEFRSRSALQHLYCGLSEFNPRMLGVDVKMWLYVVGAVQLGMCISRR
jgi:hypothetical protein